LGIGSTLCRYSPVVERARRLGFDVEGFGAAFVGALLVTIVSLGLSLFVKSSEESYRKGRRKRI
jgi:uncharacterized membrane protein YvlD (DUF360 family)